MLAVSTQRCPLILKGLTLSIRLTIPAALFIRPPRQPDHNTLIDVVSNVPLDNISSNLTLCGCSRRRNWVLLKPKTTMLYSSLRFTIGYRGVKSSSFGLPNTSSWRRSHSVTYSMQSHARRKRSLTKFWTRLV